MDAQHTLGWFRARCGHITGSNVGLLMKAAAQRPFPKPVKVTCTRWQRKGL